MPGFDGARYAAHGYQYQYLRTLEALLAYVSNAEVQSCRIEGPADASSVQDTDAIDFDIIDRRGQPLLAAQVKTTRGRRFDRGEAFGALVRLVTFYDADR